MSDQDNCCKDHIVRMNMLHDSTNKKGEYTIETVHGVKQKVPTTCTHNIELDDSYSTVEYVQKIVQWHHDRNLIEGSSDKDQFAKLIQEAGELSDNICKGKDVSDDIGDMIVVLLNIAERNGLTLRECLAKAWDDIKDRKGRMVDGIFVKEGD